MDRILLPISKERRAIVQQQRRVEIVTDSGADFLYKDEFGSVHNSSNHESGLTTKDLERLSGEKKRSENSYYFYLT